MAAELNWKTGLTIFGGVVVGTIIYRSVELYFFAKRMEVLESTLVDAADQAFANAEKRIESKLPSWLSGDESIYDAVSSEITDALDDAKRTISDQASSLWAKL